MNQLTRWVLAALVVAAISVAPRASAQNLLSNGSFETGTLGPWSASSLPGYNPGNWAVTPDNPQAGLGAAHNFFDGGLFQSAAGVTAGQTYTFSGHTYVNSGGDSNPNGSANGWGSFAQLRWLNASGNPIGGNVFDLDVDGLTRDQYNTFSQNFVAPTGATQARVLIGTFTTNVNPLDPSQGVHTVAESDWDNFSLTLAAVPEPGTYAMLALGLGMMFPVIRRRIKA
jgi:hypothetical protein